MNTARKAVCISGLAILLVAGCSSLADYTGFFALDSGANGNDRMVAGSLEAVAQSTQNTLTQLGFAATRTQKDDAVYITSKTASGASFTLVLTRAKGMSGEKTNVHLEWNGAKDDSTGLHILGQLEANSKK
jgi:hypothetical protein